MMCLDWRSWRYRFAEIEINTLVLSVWFIVLFMIWIICVKIVWLSNFFWYCMDLLIILLWNITRRYINYICFLTSSLIYFLENRRVFFEARGRKRRPNLALVFLCLFCVIVYFVLHACYCYFRFSFLVLSQEIVWDEIMYFVSGAM